MYINRALEDVILRANKSFSALLVTGPRQVGKTTMLRKLADENRKYVSLDDPIARAIAAETPTLFLA